ncbi:MAG: sigma-70 family RNA polymerase sigma factor [Ruminococcus sp.]|nr:sigma-70 family RNA polymerase sigma factor [Ruminococcus sp.]
MTTYGKLCEILPSTKGKTLPTAKQLQETAEILLQSNSITVYTNGFFTYTDGLHTTVFGVDRCTEISYKFSDDTDSVIEIEELEKMPWDVVLLMFGDSRLQENQRLREKNRLYSYDNTEQESTDLADDTDFVADLEDAEETLEMQKKLVTAINKLTMRQREVVEMYFFQEMTQQEIADALGIRQQSVCECYSSAIKALQKHMQIQQKFSCIFVNSYKSESFF